jgi:hypothetical protein
VARGGGTRLVAGWLGAAAPRLGRGAGCLVLGAARELQGPCLAPAPWQHRGLQLLQAAGHAWVASTSPHRRTLETLQQAASPCRRPSSSQPCSSLAAAAAAHLLPVLADGQQAGGLEHLGCVGHHLGGHSLGLGGVLELQQGGRLAGRRVVRPGYKGGRAGRCGARWGQNWLRRGAAVAAGQGGCGCASAVTASPAGEGCMA